MRIHRSSTLTSFRRERGLSLRRRQSRRSYLILIANCSIPDNRSTMSILLSRKRPLRLTLAVTLLLCVLSSFTTAQSSSQLTCPGKTTCRECIQSNNCRWCTQANFTKPRCHGHDIGYCPEEYTVDPSNEAIMLIDRELSRPIHGGGSMMESGYEAEMSGSSHWSQSSSSHSSSSSSSSGSMSASGHNIVQIRPQRMQLKLRLSKTRPLCPPTTQPLMPFLFQFQTRSTD